MGLKARIGSLVLGGGLGYLSYRLFRYWWTIYTTVYSKITPLEHTLSDLALTLGVIVAIMALLFLANAVSD